MKNINFTTVKTLILRKLEKLRSDLDPNSFGSCSDPEPDPNEHGNQDPDPNKVSSDPQHWDPEPAFQVIIDLDSTDHVISDKNSVNEPFCILPYW